MEYCRGAHLVCQPEDIGKQSSRPCSASSQLLAWIKEAYRRKALTLTKSACTSPSVNLLPVKPPSFIEFLGPRIEENIPAKLQVVLSRCLLLFRPSLGFRGGGTCGGSGSPDRYLKALIVVSNRLFAASFDQSTELSKEMLEVLLSSQWVVLSQ